MARSENGCGKLHFWSEIGSGFGEPGDTHPTKNCQDDPPGDETNLSSFFFFVFRQWLVKRATSLFKWFYGNVAKQNARFDVRLTVPVVIKLNFVTFLG